MSTINNLETASFASSSSPSSLLPSPASFRTISTMSSSDLETDPTTVETPTAPAPNIQRLQSCTATIHSISSRRSSDPDKDPTTVESPTTPVPDIQIIQFAHTRYTRAISPFRRYNHFLAFFALPMTLLNLAFGIPGLVLHNESLAIASISVSVVLFLAYVWSELWIWRAKKMLIRAGIARVDCVGMWEMERIFETYLNVRVYGETGMEMGEAEGGLAKRDDDARA